MGFGIRDLRQFMCMDGWTLSWFLSQVHSATWNLSATFSPSWFVLPWVRAGAVASQQSALMLSLVRWRSSACFWDVISGGRGGNPAEHSENMQIPTDCGHWESGSDDMRCHSVIDGNWTWDLPAVRCQRYHCATVPPDACNLGLLAIFFRMSGPPKCGSVVAHIEVNNYWLKWCKFEHSWFLENRLFTLWMFPYLSRAENRMTFVIQSDISWYYGNCYKINYRY